MSLYLQNRCPRKNCKVEVANPTLEVRTISRYDSGR